MLLFAMLFVLLAGSSCSDKHITPDESFSQAETSENGAVSSEIGSETSEIDITDAGMEESIDLFPNDAWEEEIPTLEETLDPSALSGEKKIAYTWCEAAYEEALNGKSVTDAPAVSWSEAYPVITNQMDRYYRYYLKGGMSMAQFKALMNSFAVIKEGKGIAMGYLDAAAQRTVADPLEEARGWVEKQNFFKAVLCLAEADDEQKREVHTIISENKDEFKSAVTEVVTDFMVRYKIAEGKAFLQSLVGCGLNAHLTSEAKRLEEYRAFQEDNLVACNVANTFENIYTHCLIAFPEINFASERTYRWCGDDCLTVHEFKTILQALYEKDYIIVDANLFYDEANDTFASTLMLPAGKKPLLLTYDDVTYDSRKSGRGMVDKLILDENGRVCTYTKHADGKEVISSDNEIFPIIAAFCREHPDFTFRGAKGTLFFTGFDGICGYRSQSEPVDDAESALRLDRQKEVQSAKVVIEALRDEGFSFGSHSYNHHNMPKYASSSLRRDTTQWLEEVGAIVGETKLFCWPYGAHTQDNVSLRKNDDHKYLFNSGFKFFFGCGALRYLADEPDDCGIFSDRKAITGEALYYYEMGYKTYIREYSYLFDPNSVWDPARLPYRYLPPYDAENDQTKNHGT